MSMPMGQCCATGSLHTGTPTGKVTKVHGLDCYVAEAPDSSPKGIIVIIPDAFGWQLPNNRILADDYAKAGFTVYLPEFMNGNAVSESALISLSAMKATGWLNNLYKVMHLFSLVGSMLPFIISCRESVAGPRVYSFLKALRQHEAKDVGVGVAGFCWGGFWVTRLCSNSVKTDDGKRLVDAGFVAHPSNLKYPDDIDNIVLPYACAAAEHDFMMSPANAKKTKETLVAKSAKGKELGLEHEFVMYQGASHGFAVRADEDEKHEAAQGKKAETQAVEWFTRWLSSPPPASSA